MHTFERKNIRIFYNGDFSGTCRIVDKNTGEMVECNSNEILQYAIEYAKYLKNTEPGKKLEYKDLV